MIVMIDMGHDGLVKGKKSPDGNFQEWEFNREIGLEVINRLRAEGIDARSTLDVPGEDYTTVSLSERAARANAAGADIFISIHSNAAGDGSTWMNAKGWSVFVANCCSSNSKKLAECLYDAHEAEGFKMRKPMPNQKYWTDNFTVLVKTCMPAVLTESLFYDNKDDLAILMSEEGKEKIISAHVAGIKKYIEMVG